jgi:molybdopterin molybdotransferase
MLAFEAALGRLLAELPTLPAESLGLERAADRVLATAPVAAVDLPPFDNSAMDGYAVRAADTANCPTRLRVIGEVRAGGWFEGSIQPGQCVRIFTGSPLPADADAVVMQEDTRLLPGEPGFIEVTEGVKPWEFVRFRGEDVRAGAVLVEAGTRLHAPQLGLLAAAGAAAVSVARAPRVALLPNGSELVPPGHALRPGQIYESNAVMLRALLQRVTPLVTALPPPPDELTAVTAALESAFATADVVVTVGGASVGEHDLVKGAFTGLGGQLEFWRLVLKPGKPFFFGRLGDKFLFGLPGNPVSAFVTAVLLVLPALRKLQGKRDPGPATTPGVLAEPLSNPDRRRHFVRVRTDATGHVRSTGTQASHLLSSLATADGLVDVPPGATLTAGLTVPVIRW